MSSVAMVLWLQDGRMFAESYAAPRDGAPPSWYQVNIVRDGPEASSWQADGCEPCEQLTFMLTDPELAIVQFRLGRRRFHYLEPTGWDGRTDPPAMHELMPPHVLACREVARRARIEHARDIALLEAGRFLPPRRDD